MNDDGEDEVEADDSAEDSEDTGTEHASGTELLASRAPPDVPAVLSALPPARPRVASASDAVPTS